MAPATDVVDTLDGSRD